MEHFWIFLLLALIVATIALFACLYEYRVVITHLGFMVAVPLAVIFVLGVRNAKARTAKAKR